ncbi:MAG: acyl-CoA dehydrogenase [Candidatus Brevundimonas phytovorans]|nr:acyl-CoA dehydrogenase [Brevundimonas sp.]WEK58163.1 MAG: acyl-CoA dehydrogenase [Brevundimonas sp.]
MTHPLIVRRDLDFMLHDWLQMETLLETPAFADHSRESIDAVLDLSEALAVDLFLPHHKASDEIEPRLEQGQVLTLPAIKPALEQYAELGLFAAGFSEDLGGLGLPFLASMASFSFFAAANIATSAYPMLTTANARLIATFGSAAQVETFALPQIAGRWFGTMCLSEPQAGSNLADVRTRAVADGDDHLGPRYRLSGNKMWISGGDQDISENIVHLVLAKIPGADGGLPDGTGGLSLFIVPKILPDGRRNDVSVAGLNHKMGYRGTSNCLLNFGEGDGAIGWRIGAPGRGLQQMFLMMNEARIGVGLGAAALGYRGYRHALRYAQERIQGQRDGVAVAIIEHPDVRQMLLTQKAYAEGALALCLYCAKLVDQPEDADAAALLGLLTPVAKTWPSEYGLAANDIAIQIHGGYGYTRDFDVEQLYRENRLNPIHEGTTGIQGQDLLGRKILRADGAGMAVLERRMMETCARAHDAPALAQLGDALTAAWAEVKQTVEAIQDLPEAVRLDNATAFLRGFGHVVTAWLWLDQAVAAGAGGSDPFHAGKVFACRFFFEFELPKTTHWLTTAASANRLTATVANDCF